MAKDGLTIMPDIVFQTCFTQKYCFPEPPPAHIRNMLTGAGFRYDGTCWQRTIGTASALSPSEAKYIISLDYKDYSESGLAPSTSVL